ncbi:MAG TPA: MFS transporter [Candidatus Saccharimonadales bacterium]|nr:MFS transporter [Candidatus Saccharimonadales bacterium]
MKLPLVLHPLRNRDFRLLWTGQTVSVFGNFVHQVAVPFQLLALGASPIQLGIGASISTAMGLLLFLFAGAIVDRVPRRRVILACDLLSGIVVLAIALLSLTGTLRIEHIYIEAAFFGATGAFFMPAMGAIIPELVPADILVQGNTLRSFSRQGARLTGPVIGGLIVASAGPGWAFLADSLTFFVSFLVLLAASSTRRAPAPRQPILREIREGVVFTFSLPWLWITILVFAFANATYAGPLIVAMPLYVRNVLLADAGVFGLINASNGIGEIVGGILLGQLRLRRIGIAMYVAAAFGSLWLAMYGLLPIYPVLLLYGVGLGMGFIGFGVLWDTAVQRHVPHALLGRVGSVDGFGSILLLPLAPLAAGALVEQFGPAAVLAGGGLLSTALCVFPLLIPSIRQLRA